MLIINKRAFISTLFILTSLHFFPLELAIPGPLPEPEPVRVDIAAPDPKPTPPPIPAPIPVRSFRKVKMDQIISRFKRGYQPSEKEHLIDFIFTESIESGFDPELILALISTESSFNHRAISSQGAIGLMQIIPSTGKAIARVRRIAWHDEEKPLFDPFVNIRLGIHYLHSLNERFHDIRIALAAYNHGPTKIRRRMRQGKIPVQYADKVLHLYRSYLGPKIQSLDMT